MAAFSKDELRKEINGELIVGEIFDIFHYFSRLYDETNLRPISNQYENRFNNKTSIYNFFLF